MQSRSDAERTLLEIERVRHHTRRTLHPTWYENLVVGLFFLGATLTSAVASGRTLPIAYWAIGVPLGLALIVRHALRRERELGAEAPLADPGSAIFAATVAGVIVLNQLTDSPVAWAYAVAAGWLALGAVLRDALMTAAGVALAVIATGIVAVEPSGAGLWAQLALALLLIAAGVAGRAQERA
jgi:hypothetical protein